MLFSGNQIVHRLAICGVQVGDVEFDPFDGRVEVYGKTHDRLPARFKITLPASIDDIVEGCRHFMFAQKHEREPQQLQPAPFGNHILDHVKNGEIDEKARAGS